MNRIFLPILCLVLGASLVGCVSSETPQASAQVAKDFKGGPMPADFAKGFQKGFKKPGPGQKAPDGAKP